MDSAVYELSHKQWLTAVGYDDLEKDDDGYVVLRPTASHVDRRVAALTTDIGELETKLRSMRAEKAEAKQYQKTEQYQESKKKEKDKKSKKKRDALLSMVFNNAPNDLDEDEDSEEEEGYRDGKKKRGRPKKTETTLETRYGKRYAPIVTMLYDSVADFDKIANEIDEELKSQKGQVRNMYRSTQIGNLLSAKEKKLSAIKEIARVTDKVTDIEYKREKDAKVEDASRDTSKAIANLGSKYLRGVFDFDDDGKGSKSSKGSKKGKKDKDKKGESNFARSARDMGYDPDEDEVERKKSKKNSDDSSEDLAKALAKELMGRAGDYSFSVSEKFINMEGKWSPAITCDALDPEGTAKIVALDKNGKIIKGFKDDYPGLLPSMKKMKLRFDINKRQAYDSNTGKRYKLLFTE